MHIYNICTWRINHNNSYAQVWLNLTPWVTNWCFDIGSDTSLVVICKGKLNWVNRVSYNTINDNQLYDIFLQCSFFNCHLTLDMVFKKNTISILFPLYGHLWPEFMIYRFENNILNKMWKCNWRSKLKGLKRLTLLQLFIRI